MFQYAEFADEALLLLLAQTAVATASQQVVPAPSPDEKAFDRFRLGARGTRASTTSMQKRWNTSLCSPSSD